MNTDKRNNRNEEDVDLTGIINEYSQDNELRKKINEMKKQKEAEKQGVSQAVNPLTNEEYKSPLYNEVKKVPDITVDQDADKTRVNFEDAQDQTLVIMNGKKSMTVDSEADATFTVYDEDEEDEEIGKTVVTPLSEMKDVHVLEETDEEDEEDEENQEEDKKLNKRIMYGIIGVVTAILVVGIFFGGKYLFDSLGGGADKTPEVPTDTNPDTDITKPEEDTDKNEDEDTNITDQSAKIAALQKQQKEFEANLVTINEKLSAAQSRQKEAEKNVANIKSKEWPKVQKAQKAAENYTDPEYELAKSNYEAATTEADKKILKEILDEKEKAYNTAYQKLVTAAANASTDYYSKYNTANDELTAAKKDVTTYTSKQAEMNKKIEDVKKELKDLESE